MTTTPEVSAKTLTQLVALEIRLAMVRHELKQSQLARLINKTEQWLSVRLRGRQPIDLNDLALIARALDVPVHELLPDPGAPIAVGGPSTMPRYGTSAERSAQQRPPATRPKNRKPDGHPDLGRTARVPRPTRP